jgi:hypothetical protein
VEIAFPLQWAVYLQVTSILVSPKIKDTNLLTLFSKLLNGVIHKYQVSFRTVKKKLPHYSTRDAATVHVVPSSFSC